MHARPPDDPAHIQVRDLVAAYDDKVVVHGVSFSVSTGSHLSLLGPSGCGKSTVLRCIAGLETPIGGEIEIDGRVVFSAERNINVPAEKRHLSMVFQSYAIWPHMSVFENVGFGLKLRGVKGKELRRRVQEALEMVGMANLIDRPATALSGGQQQRVALARAYAFQPKAVLLDEPLSNLDAILRVQMREELKDLQSRNTLTTIYVTHDQEEAMAISDRIIVMREGRIEQEGAPLDVYDRPRTHFVADFIGAANVLTAEIVDGPDGMRCRVGDAEVEVSHNLGKGGSQLLAVRTVYPTLSPIVEMGVNCWPAQITRRALLGDSVHYIVKWPGGSMRVHSLPDFLLEEGQDVGLHIPPNRLVVLDDDLAGAG